jgi:uncharacterized protein
MAPFETLPAFVAWRLAGAADGYEVAFFDAGPWGVRLRGATAAVEDGSPWSVRYEIELDQRWNSRRARIWSLSTRGENRVTLEVDGEAHWRVDGSRRSDLEGCRDIDLEASACTNTIPIHRLGLEAGDSADAPAVYVRWLDLSVERLEQEYHRLNDDKTRLRFDYRAPRFDYAATLVFDRSGLVLSYPGIASRVARDPRAL